MSVRLKTKLKWETFLSALIHIVIFLIYSLRNPWMAPLPTQWNNDFQLSPPSLYGVNLFRLLNYFIPLISSRPFRRQTQRPYCDGTNEQWKFHLLFGCARCFTNQMFSSFHMWSIWKNTIRILEAHLLPYLINLHIHLALFGPDGSTVIGYQFKLYLKTRGAKKLSWCALRSCRNSRVLNVKPTSLKG